MELPHRTREHYLLLLPRIRIALFSICLSILALSASSTRAQLPLSTTPEEHSAGFGSSLESDVEAALSTFRELSDPTAAGVMFDAKAQFSTERNSDQGLRGSATLFQSLAKFYAHRPEIAQELNERVLRNSGRNTLLNSKASLLSALEHFSHSPLTRDDIEAGLNRLNSLTNESAIPPAILPEVYFWRAEGERALGFDKEALLSYSRALNLTEDRNTRGLTFFRRGELFEYRSQLDSAERDFRAVVAIEGSPLQLLSTLRVAAIERAKSSFLLMLRDLAVADSFERALPHYAELSARDLNYLSPLIEQMLLRSVEGDRVLGSLAQPEAEHVAASAGVAQLASPFVMSEIALLRGSALSGLSLYDSASNVLVQGIAVLNAAPDTIQSHFVARQRNFLRDALTFERAWAEFRQQRYKLASSEFLSLVDRDSSVHRLISRDANLTLREQGRFADPFYEEVDTIRTATLGIAALDRSPFDTSFFIYNDFPERARFYAAVALARAGEFKQAEHLFVGLTQDRSVIYSSLANYQLGLLKFAEKNYVEAGSILEPIATEQTETGAFSALLMGEIAYRKSNFEKAERYFRQALAQLPDTLPRLRATAYLERGLSLITLNNWEQARHDLRTYLKLSPNDAPPRLQEALFWLGRADFRAGQLDSARNELARFLKRYPNAPRAVDAEYHYAWTLFRLNQWDSAEAHFEQVVALDSVTRYAYDVLARAADSYYALGDYDDATDLYNQAIDRPAFNNYRTTRTLYQLGLTRLRLDSARSAIRSFQYLLRKFPTTELADQANFNIALAAYAINQPAEAEAALDRIGGASKNTALVPRSLLLLADERMSRGLPEGAIPVYQKILDQHSGSNQAIPALFNMQEALIGLKRYGQALAAADTFVARMPMSTTIPSVMLRKGELEFGLSQWKAAAETMRNYILAYPGNPQIPEARLVLGRSEAIAGDTASALEQFRIVLQDSGENAAPAEAHYELARINRNEHKALEASQEYMNAFAMKYYSTDAAPKALAEYAEYLVERSMKDSAIKILHELSDRYSLATKAGAKAEIRAAQLLEEQNHRPESQASLLRVANARKDMLGGIARVRLAETYMRDTTWHTALAELQKAKTEHTLSNESDVRRLFDLYQTAVVLKKKPVAVAALKSLLNETTLTSREEERAQKLLESLVPPKKTKPHKKGGHSK